MLVTAVGVSGSYPGPDSPASCYLVQAEHEGRTWSLALDLGNGSVGALQRYAEPVFLDAVLLSHLHPDHCLDICPLYVMLAHHPRHRREGRMPVHAPAGAAGRLARAYEVDAPADLTDRYEFCDLADGQVFEVGPFRVTPVPVFHPVTTFGFRVEADGGVVAYTGDTGATPRLTDLMRGADLVLADSAFVDGRDHAVGVHMSGRQVAEAAEAAGGVKRLVLTHIPSWNDAEQVRAQAAAIRPDAEVATPGAVYEVGT